MFAPGASDSLEGVLASWKRKYLFPFGDIAPIGEQKQEAELLPHDESDMSEMQLRYQAAEENLPIEYKLMSDLQNTKSFEKLMS